MIIKFLLTDYIYLKNVKYPHFPVYIIIVSTLFKSQRKLGNKKRI